MRWIVSILALCITGGVVYAQEIDNDEFSKQFSSLFKNIINGVDSYKEGDAKVLQTGNGPITSWETALLLDGATKAWIEHAPDLGVAKYIAEYDCGSDIKNADRIIDKLKREVGYLTPANYHDKEGYSWIFSNNIQYVFELNSPTFADVQKKPSIIIGRMEDGGRYSVQIHVVEPYFKGQ